MTSNEGRACTWSELTTYEQNEVTQRGFPRESNTRYVPKRVYVQEAGELSLLRWFSEGGTSRAEMFYYGGSL